MNLILNTDSYKLSHAALYPPGIKGMSAYIEARKPDEQIVFFGLQMWIMKNLLKPIQRSDIDEAAYFAKEHGEPFDTKPWDYILQSHGGYLPIRIYAVPEGTRVPSQNVLVRIDCDDPKIFWLPMYIETALQRAVWYPSTIASNDYKNWRMIRRFWLETSDGEPSFALHDFGARGVSSEESAEIGGAAHLIYFSGSDNISGIRAANKYYGSKMSGFSVPATEHSVQCAWGPIRQREYLEHVLNTYAKPGAIVSIVLDAYNTLREAKLLCLMSEKIIASGARIVFRPDSGDPLEIIPKILAMQEATFGSVTNSKGFKVINNVGIIQGDGVDYQTMEAILKAITERGYSAANIVFGSGGALLQKVNRDTYGFAQKASAILTASGWQGIKKDTPGKISKAGWLELYRNVLTGEYETGNFPFNSEWIPQLQIVYDNGILKNQTTLNEVRERAKS